MALVRLGAGETRDGRENAWNDGEDVLREKIPSYWSRDADIFRFLSMSHLWFLPRHVFW